MIHRVVRPWLIRRLIDPRAGFLFVAPAQVAAVADRAAAETFDIRRVRVGHTPRRCPFDALLELKINRPKAFDRMAQIARADDLGRPDKTSEAPGLTSNLPGVSRIERDDLAQVESAMPVPDALYRWARGTRDKTHREDLA